MRLGGHSADTGAPGRLTPATSAFVWYVLLILLGYALLGRGFAYLGVPPVFVGEIGLALAACVLVGRVLVPVWETRITGLAIAFMVWGLVNTLPYIPRHGMDALRDGAQWGYAVYAFAVATVLLRSGSLANVSEWYGGFSRIFLLSILPALVLFHIARDIIPVIPWGPGEGVHLLHVRKGNVAVHLAGVAAFMALSLGQKPLKHFSWLALWILAALFVVAAGRAAFLTLAIPLIALAVLRPFSRWYRPVLIVGLGVVGLMLLDVEIDVGDGGRTLSAEALLTSIGSIFQDNSVANYTDTKEWRLLWWEKILGYTVFGDYFWTGKGYGINLASSDGFQIFWDESLRSPHNVHLTVLARGGVPGFLLWIWLQAAFAFALLRLARQDRRAGDHAAADFSLWILLYWVGFIVNATFDVYLEGPQGAIWFWCLFGVGIAQIVHRRALWRGSAGSSQSGNGLPTKFY